MDGWQSQVPSRVYSIYVPATCKMRSRKPALTFGSLNRQPKHIAAIAVPLVASKSWLLVAPQPPQQVKEAGPRPNCLNRTDLRPPGGSRLFTPCGCRCGGGKCLLIRSLIVPPQRGAAFTRLPGTGMHRVQLAEEVPGGRPRQLLCLRRCYSFVPINYSFTCLSRCGLSRPE